MRHGLLLLAFVLCVPVGSAAQPPACKQELAKLNVPRSSYAEITAAPFQRRVFLYVPEIEASGASGFAKFQVWVVEGVYGRPFVQPAGSLDEAGFHKLRGSQNVRTTAISVARGDGSEWGQFRIGRDSYRVQVQKVSAGPKGAVQARVCR